MAAAEPGGSRFRVHPEPWVAFRPALEAMLEPLSDAVIAALAPRPGDRVLDVGCGCGATTLELAGLVHPEGIVTGIDISPSVLEVARGAATADEVDNLSFVEGDAATFPFEPQGFDAVFSRLGTMFFDEPGSAFANLRRALRPGGRLGFVCWRTLEENGWAAETRAAVAAILPEQTPPPAPDHPGPFSLGSAERLSSLLAEAGFVDVEIEPHDEPLLVGRGDVDEAVELFARMLPTGYLMIEPDRHAGDRVRAALRLAFERHIGDDGLRMGSASWIVRGR